MFNKALAATAVAIFFLLITMSYAHLDGGLDAEVGNYIVDLGYSPAEPIAGSRTSFAINLLNATTREAVAPEKVWARISSAEGVVFAGTFHPEAGNVAFAYAFPEKGAYGISLRFSTDSEAIAEADFELAVAEGAGNSSFDYRIPLYILAAILLVYIAAKSRLLNFPKKRNMH